MRVSRPTASVALLGVGLLLAFVLIWPRKAHPISITWTIAEQELIEAVLSQGELGIVQKYVLKETTSIREILWKTGYEELSKDLREQTRPNHRTLVDKVHDFVTRAKLPQRYDDAFREALEDFLLKNKTGIQIVFSTNPPANVELASETVLDEIFSAKHDATPDGWDLFYHRFPKAGGLISVSRVGIDAKGTVAIVYVGRRTGYLAGEGSIRILKRKGNKWVLHVSEHIGPRWIS